MPISASSNGDLGQILRDLNTAEENAFASNPEGVTREEERNFVKRLIGSIKTIAKGFPNNSPSGLVVSASADKDSVVLQLNLSVSRPRLFAKVKVAIAKKVVTKKVVAKKANKKVAIKKKTTKRRK